MHSTRNATKNHHNNNSNDSAEVVTIYGVIKDNKIIAYKDWLAELDEEPQNLTLFDPKPLQDYLIEIEKGKELVANKDYETASRLFSDLSDSHPYNLDAYFEAAKLYEKRELFESAIAIYDFILKKCYTHLPARLALRGAYMLSNKQAEENLRFLNELIDEDEKETKPLYQDDIIKCELHKIHLIRTLQINFTTHYNKTLRETFSGMQQQSIPMQRFTVPSTLDYKDTQHSNGAAEYTFMGQQAFRVENIKTAEFYFQKAILKFPDDVIAISYLAYLNRYQGNPGKAKTELAKAIEKYDAGTAYFFQGCIQRDEGDLEEAINSFHEYLIRGTHEDFDLAPAQRNNLLNTINRSEWMVITGGATALPEDYESWLKIPEKIADKNYNNKQAEIDMYRMTQAIELNPLYASCYYGRAFIYAFLKNTKLALRDYSTAIMLANPAQLPTFYLARAIAFLGAGEDKKANLDLENAIGHIPTIIDPSSLALQFIQKFKYHCLEEGKRFIAANEPIIADRILSSAIKLGGTIELFIQVAIALEMQKSYRLAVDALSNAAIRIHNSDNKKDKTTLLTRVNTALQRCKASIREEAQAQQQKKTFSSSEIKNIGQLVKDKNKSGTTGRIHSVLAKNASVTSSKSPKAEDKMVKQARLEEERQKNIAAAALKKAEAERLEKENAAIEAYLKEQEIQERIIREEKEALRKKNKANKQKAKNRLRKNKVKLGSKKSVSLVLPETESDEHESPILTASIPPCSPSHFDQNITVELLAPERVIFDIFERFNKTSNTQYKSYVVGGSVYDQVREKLFNKAAKNINDIDFGTETPFTDSYQLFNGFQGFKTNPDMPEYMSFELTIGQTTYSIDIFHKESLADLNADAMTRDFFALYKNKHGEVADHGFSIHSMQTNRLRSVNLSSKVFTQDPIRILRGIYTASKRELKIPKELLTQMKNNVPELLKLPVGKLCGWLAKTLSQNMAINNFKWWLELGILDVLFPEIITELKADREWLIRQVSYEASRRQNLPLEIVYAALVASVTMTRMSQKLPSIFERELPGFKRRNDFWRQSPKSEKSEIEAYRQRTAIIYISLEYNEIISKTPLFKVMENSPYTLANLSRAILNWKNQHPDIFSHHPSNKQVEEKMPEYEPLIRLRG